MRFKNQVTVEPEIVKNEKHLQYTLEKASDGFASYLRKNGFGHFLLDAPENQPPPLFQEYRLDLQIFKEEHWMEFKLAFSNKLIRLGLSPDKISELRKMIIELENRR